MITIPLSLFIIMCILSGLVAFVMLFGLVCLIILVVAYFIDEIKEKNAAKEKKKEEFIK